MSEQTYPDGYYKAVLSDDPNGAEAVTVRDGWAYGYLLGSDPVSSLIADGFEFAPLVPATDLEAEIERQQIPAAILDALELATELADDGLCSDLVRCRDEVEIAAKINAQIDQIDAAREWLARQREEEA